MHSILSNFMKYLRQFIHVRVIFTGILNSLLALAHSSAWDPRHTITITIWHTLHITAHITLHEPPSPKGLFTHRLFYWLDKSVNRKTNSTDIILPQSKGTSMYVQISYYIYHHFHPLNQRIVLLLGIFRRAPRPSDTRGHPCALLLSP
jgi:hypothetical protein